MNTFRTAAALTVVGLVLAGCGSPEPGLEPADTDATAASAGTTSTGEAASGEESGFVPGPQGDPEPSAADGSFTLSSDEPSVLTYEYQGTKGTVTVPAEPDEQLERYRRGVGYSGPVVYAEVEIDNREGAEPFPVQGLTLSTPDGGEALFVAPTLTVAAWSEKTEPSPEMQELATIIEAQYKAIGASGEVETVPLVLSGELPTEVTSAALQLPAFNEIPVVPAE